MSKIYFFRHAQASLGSDNYDVLSKKGELQALELVKYLVANKYKFDKIYVGVFQGFVISRTHFKIYVNSSIFSIK